MPVSKKRKLSQTKLAPDFLPTFAASKIGQFSGNKSEMMKIRLLRQFKPFSEIELNSSTTKETKIASEPEMATNKKASRSLLNKNEKEMIKQTLNESINLNRLTFNDVHVVKRFGVKLALIQQQQQKSSSVRINTNKKNPVRGAAGNLHSAKLVKAVKLRRSLRLRGN